MSYSIPNTFNKNIVSLFLFCNMYFCAFAQTDSTSKIVNFRVAASVTNNGFSFIPAFSLGKPAAIFNFNINGGKRFSFDPEFRFALKDGRPWSFIFIWRYKMINQKRFQFTFGSHFPAVPFRILAYENTPEIKNTLAVSRVVPFEFTPNLIINKNHSLSAFILYAKGISDDAVNHTSVFMIRSVSSFPLSKNVKLRVNPQLFKLNLDEKSGYYFASNFTLSSNKTPFYLGSTINKAFDSNIGGKAFNWNLSLGYAIDRKLIVKK